MKAQVFYAPGDLRFEDLPVPEPGDGEIVVKVEAALTCGTDVKVLRRGHPVMIPHVPTVFGHELAGTVGRVGRGVTAFREGDRVVAANSAPAAPAASVVGSARISARISSSSTAPTVNTSPFPPGSWRPTSFVSATRCPRGAPPSPSRWPARCSVSSGDMWRRA